MAHNILGLKKKDPLYNSMASSLQYVGCTVPGASNNSIKCLQFWRAFYTSLLANDTLQMFTKSYSDSPCSFYGEYLQI